MGQIQGALKPGFILFNTLLNSVRRRCHAKPNSIVKFGDNAPQTLPPAGKDREGRRGIGRLSSIAPIERWF
uniref:Uncharacterized protein n=1 Tax=Oryza brachyantha TaxID=4533 RepID=J3M6E2_ORYBR